ncbi:hypothetical protein [Marinirhabdus gelatinilytica]|uniref:Uncharacterized protein n=1 Tax=Marinirhabdus gelatinilytica TaxID=1703343 RepID=A0A370QG15_9FLAO|nr:hypothetical protein [Marinirhabdus gelatinilytica]RDK87305.1 hypothetical protein C8D94_102492 [Marinirhabdus gelatinilytica]
MKKKSPVQNLYAVIPLVFSGVLCIALIFLLQQKTTVPAFVDQLTNLATLFIGISGFVAVLLVVYLASATLRLKSVRSNAVNHLDGVTQKMHHFRNIVDILYRSKMWPPGLKEYIDDEFEGLTFFDVKEFYKGKSKLAIEFLQENNNFEDTENLYLELKSLLLLNPKEKKVPENISYPNAYPKEIVSKWLEHKCGSGLWYYFGYKFAIFKDFLDLDAVFERHQEKIIVLANSIDSQHFEDSSFNDVFLARLGEYMNKQVFPKLFQFQDNAGKGLPGIMKYLYAIFLAMSLFGVLLPLLYLLLGLPIITLVVSFSIVVSTIFFISTTFFQFLNREIS